MSVDEIDVFTDCVCELCKWLANILDYILSVNSDVSMLFLIGEDLCR